MLKKLGLALAAATGLTLLAVPAHAVLMSYQFTGLCDDCLGVLGDGQFEAVTGTMVLEDYVHSDWLKVTTLVASKLAHVLLGAAGVYAVLRIALTGEAG